MASILDRYGIKEVADVTFYEIGSTGKPTKPVLFLDTLKVSTIEQTGEQAEARGGKGNPPLIIWDYGKEINVTLEDALFSAKSMAIMFGNGNVIDEGTNKKIMRTEIYSGNSYPDLSNYKAKIGGKEYSITNAVLYDDTGSVIESNSFATQKTDKMFLSYNIATKGLGIIEISANSFPGTYYVTGDTYARAEVNGADEFFQFIIPKAKVTSENTITLEAEGDPSVFNLNLRVLRPSDGVMMKLVKYDMTGKDINTASTWYDATDLTTTRPANNG